jgi:hypothetical protein
VQHFLTAVALPLATAGLGAAAGLAYHDLLARWCPPDEPEYEDEPNPEGEARWLALLARVDAAAEADYAELRRRAE